MAELGIRELSLLTEGGGNVGVELTGTLGLLKYKTDASRHQAQKRMMCVLQQSSIALQHIVQTICLSPG